MNRFSNQSIKNSKRLENFVDQALAAHTVISVEVSRQLLLALSNSTGLTPRALKLKQALALIDQLDLFLESPFQIEHFYLNLQLELFEMLKELGMSFPPLPTFKDKHLDARQPAESVYGC